MTAWGELNKELGENEAIEAICFGPWGWGSAPKDGEDWELSQWEPDGPPVPFDLRGKLLKPSQASHMMQSWSFYGGYGSPDCYATYVWTNKRVIWVTQYDGSTVLDSVPRNPTECMPEMPGG